MKGSLRVPSIDGDFEVKVKSKRSHSKLQIYSTLYYKTKMRHLVEERIKTALAALPADGDISTEKKRLRFKIQNEVLEEPLQNTSGGHSPTTDQAPPEASAGSRRLPMRASKTKAIALTASSSSTPMELQDSGEDSTGYVILSSSEDEVSTPKRKRTAFDRKRDMLDEGEGREIALRVLKKLRARKASPTTAPTLPAATVDSAAPISPSPALAVSPPAHVIEDHTALFRRPTLALCDPAPALVELGSGTVDAQAVEPRVVEPQAVSQAVEPQAVELAPPTIESGLIEPGAAKPVEQAPLPQVIGPGSAPEATEPVKKANRSKKVAKQAATKQAAKDSSAVRMPTKPSPAKAIASVAHPDNDEENVPTRRSRREVIPKKWLTDP
jgi:hypothetical protein